jgi:ABC-type multidrug transport system permease subunit
MSITNYPWNLTPLMNNSANASATLPGALTHTIASNLPWWFPGLTVVFAIALWIMFSNDPGKEKFLYIAFLSMIFSWLLRMFTLVSTTIPTMWTGLFIAVTVWYLITRDN